MSVLPFDITEILLAELQRGRRPNDGLLHASSHLTGSLRHAQLDVVGAPKIESELLSEITLMTGTMWHEYIHATLRREGVPYMAEVNMTPWMPLGWGGTLDGLMLNPELNAFVLCDFKTVKGEGIYYLNRDGAKDEHIHQVSLYWHAAKQMLKGTAKIAKVCAVYYLPKNDTRRKDETIEPVLADFEPIPLADLTSVTKYRADRVDAYKASLVNNMREHDDSSPTVNGFALSSWLTDELEPVQERVQNIYFDRKTDTYDVKLMPHWSTAYCPFPEELCDCNTQGQTKIGMVDETGQYHPRPGYEHVKPTPEVLSAVKSR